MPQCSDYGQGWVGEYPNCRYEPSTPGGQQQPPFTGTVGSLGFLGLLPEGQDWSQYFDPYDPTEERMSTIGAGIDIGQLGAAWGLEEEQLGEAWGLRGAQLGETLGLGREQLGESWRLQEGGLGEQWGGQQQELGAGARRGFQDVEQMGQEMTRRGRGLTFGGQRQRQAEEEVSGTYKRSFGLGQSAYERAMESGQSRYEQGLEAQTLGYEQAMGVGQLAYDQALETGQLALQQGTTDIYQGLESNIFGQRRDWRSEQRATLNTLLGWDPSRTSGGGDGDGVNCDCYGSGYYLSGNNCVDVTGSVIGTACDAPPPPGNGGKGGNGGGTGGTGGTGTGGSGSSGGDVTRYPGV